MKTELLNWPLMPSDPRRTYALRQDSVLGSGLSVSVSNQNIKATGGMVSR